VHVIPRRHDDAGLSASFHAIDLQTRVEQARRLADVIERA